MTKEMLLELGITEEQAAKVLEKAAEEQKGFIPRERFNEVNEAKKSLDAQLKERDKQLKDLQSKAGDNEELKKQIASLQEQNKAAAKEYKASLHNRCYFVQNSILQFDAGRRSIIADKEV